MLYRKAKAVLIQEPPSKQTATRYRILFLVGLSLARCRLRSGSLSLRNYRRQRLRDLVRKDIALVLDHLVDQLELLLIEILCHEDAVLIDRHRVNSEQLISKILEER